MMHEEHDFEKREPDLEKNKSMMHRTILIKYILWLIFLYVEDNLWLPVTSVYFLKNRF